MSRLDERQRGEVVEQLERVLADDRFSSSERSSRFLRYIVERTLEGRAGEIKEVVVAVELYARGADYDPRADSTVRVEASRLRGKLDRYYTGAGARDPVRITIPRGGYVPQFEWTRAAVPAAVLPRADASPSAPVATDRARTRRRVGGSLLLASVIATLIWWALRPGQASAGSAPVGPRAASPYAHAEALAAWQEGNELLRQDPHSGVSDRGVPRTLARALERYELAVARSPGFAKGWASLAEAYEYASAFVGRRADDDARRAEEAARRAVALDPRLAEGHAMLALVLFYLRWDFAGAEAAYRRAIALEPRSTWAIVEFADLLRETGRTGDAAAEIRRARALQPALPILALKEAEILLDQGRSRDAIAVAAAAHDLKRDSERALVVLGAAYELDGDRRQAVTLYRRALEINPYDRRALPALGYLLGRLGRGDEARAILRRLEEMNTRVRNCAYQAAVVHAGLGDRDRALAWLERAFETRQMHVPFLVVEHRFHALRPHPRFQTIVGRLGLPLVPARPAQTSIDAWAGSHAVAGPSSAVRRRGHPR